MYHMEANIVKWNNKHCT